MEAAARDPRTKVDRPLWWGNHLGEVRWQLDAARLLVHPVLRGRTSLLLARFPRRRLHARSDGALATQDRLQAARQWDLAGALQAARRRRWSAWVCAPPRLWRMKPAGASDSSATAVAPTRAGPGGAPPRSGLPRDRARGRPQPADGRQRADRSGGGAEALQRRSFDREQQGCLAEDCRCSFTRDYSAPFPEEVRLTSIYSKGDGVVRWQSCVVPYAYNVEVSGTHVGLALNPRPTSRSRPPCPRLADPVTAPNPVVGEDGEHGRRSDRSSPRSAPAPSWGQRWWATKGNGRDGVQTRPDELDSRYRAESRAQTSPTEQPARSTKPKVTGSNPVGAVHEAPAKAGVLCFHGS